jgi:hypothetical protein
LFDQCFDLVQFLRFSNNRQEDSLIALYKLTSGSPIFRMQKIVRSNNVINLLFNASPPGHSFPTKIDVIHQIIYRGTASRRLETSKDSPLDDGNTKTLALMLDSCFRRYLPVTLSKKRVISPTSTLKLVRSNCICSSED